jgi:hypothetical protein
MSFRRLVSSNDCFHNYALRVLMLTVVKFFGLLACDVFPEDYDDEDGAGHPDCEAGAKCYSCLVRSSSIYEPEQDFMLYQFKLILTLAPCPEIWKRFLNILQVISFYIKLKKLDPDIERVCSFPEIIKKISAVHTATVPNSDRFY